MSEPNEKERDFLQPLRNRPHKDPDREFINRLQGRLIQSSNRRRQGIFPVAIGSLALATCIALVFLFFNQSPRDIHLAVDSKETIEDTPQDGIRIAEHERAEVVLELPYGEETDSAGLPQKRAGGSDRAMESFFVKDDVFYLLDNAARKVIVTTPAKHLLTIQLDDSEEGERYTWYQDVFVDEGDNIYVLDSTTREVIKYSPEGEQIEVYPIRADMMAPNTVTVNEKKEIIVQDVRPMSENLMTGEVSRTPKTFEKEDTTVQVLRKDDKTEEIRIDKAGKEQKVTVQFEHSTGGIRVLDIRSNQIIFEKTEVADTSKIMVEFHVYVIDGEGNIVGAVREPYEQTAFYSTHFLRMVNDKIYFLSAGNDSVIIYELIPGKQFEKKLQARIDEFLNE